MRVVPLEGFRANFNKGWLSTVPRPSSENLKGPIWLGN